MRPALWLLLLVCLSCASPTEPPIQLTQGQPLTIGEQTIALSATSGAGVLITNSSFVDAYGPWLELLLVPVLLGVFFGLVAVLEEVFDPHNAPLLWIPLAFVMLFVGLYLAGYDDAAQVITIDTEQGTYQQTLDGTPTQSIPLKRCSALTLPYKKGGKGNASYYKIIFECDDRKLIWGRVTNQKTATELRQILSDHTKIKLAEPPKGQP